MSKVSRIYLCIRSNHKSTIPVFTIFFHQYYVIFVMIFFSNTEKKLRPTRIFLLSWKEKNYETKSWIRHLSDVLTNTSQNIVKKSKSSSNQFSKMSQSIKNLRGSSYISLEFRAPQKMGKRWIRNLFMSFCTILSYVILEWYHDNLLVKIK